MPTSAGAGETAVRPRAVAELGLLVAVYVTYSVVRVLADADPEAARANGLHVLSLERALGLDHEAAAGQWLVRSTALSVVAAYAYATLHYTVTPAVLLWLYRVHPEHYARARSCLVLSTCVALVFYWLLPTAPPRLLADAYPDVLARTSDYGWWGTEASAPRGLGTLTNQYAAMPSMHVGWAVWCGLAVAARQRHVLARAAALAYPVGTTLVVVVTANHFVLDAVAGATLVVGLWGRRAVVARPVASPLCRADSGRPRPQRRCRSASNRGSTWTSRDGAAPRAGRRHTRTCPSGPAPTHPEETRCGSFTRPWRGSSCRAGAVLRGRWHGHAERCGRSRRSRVSPSRARGGGAGSGPARRAGDVW